MNEELAKMLVAGGFISLLWLIVVGVAMDTVQQLPSIDRNRGAS